MSEAESRNPETEVRKAKVFLTDYERKEVKYLAKIGFRQLDEINEFLDRPISISTKNRILRDEATVLTPEDIEFFKAKYGSAPSGQIVVKTELNDDGHVVGYNVQKVKEGSGESKMEDKINISSAIKEALEEDQSGITEIDTTKLVLPEHVIEKQLYKLFGVNIEDLIYVSDYEKEEKRDLVIIATEFEELFGIEAAKDIVSSFQEKYEALRRRNLNALKIILERINYVYRRSISEGHKWKFEAEGNKTRTSKIMGNIINMIKSELDGTTYRALSEQQHKTVQIICNILKIDETKLSLEAEAKLMKLIGEHNTFDVINQCVTASRYHDPELHFFNLIEERLAQ